MNTTIVIFETQIKSLEEKNFYALNRLYFSRMPIQTSPTLSYQTMLL